MSNIESPIPPDATSPPSASAHPPPIPEDERNHSPLLILFGLLVVWGSLYLVAVAQNLSYPPGTEGSPATPLPPAVYASPPVQAGESPVSSMLVPVESINLKEIPARQVVKDLLYKAHLHIEAEELDKIGSAVRDVHFENKPLYECLYSALDEDTLGLMVVDDQVRFIPQQLTHQFPDQGPLEQFNWDADLLLAERAVSLFPTGRSPLWVRLRLIPGGDASEDRIAFEIFNLGAREGMGEAVLPAAGAGTLRFVTGSALSLHIENRGEVGNVESEKARQIPIRVRLQYQSMNVPADNHAETGTPTPVIEATEVKTPVES